MLDKTSEEKISDNVKEEDKKKKCHKCNQEKSILCFSKHSGTKDKLDNRCKECVKRIKKDKDSQSKILEYPVYELDLSFKDWQVGKPTGTILERTDSKSNAKRYEVRIPLGNGKLKSKSFAFNKYDTQELAKKDADKYLTLTSKELGLTRNLIKIIDEDTIEVKLTKDKIMKTNMKYSDICQKYTLVSTKSGHKDSEYYAAISINNKLQAFHKFITGNDMTDHKNRDPLDNRIKNLLKTNHKLNNNNRSAPKKYKDDPNHILGVRYIEKTNVWEARIKQDDKQYSKNYSVNKYGYEKAKKKAIKARKKFNFVFNCKNS